MKTNAERAQFVEQKTRRIGEWRIAPHWIGRMNKKTLGCETGSGKQGSTVFWFKWAIYFEESQTPMVEFEKFKDAKEWVRNRIQSKATTEYGYHG